MARALVRPARAINSVVRHQQITETEITMTINTQIQLDNILRIREQWLATANGEIAELQRMAGAVVFSEAQSEIMSVYYDNIDITVDYNKELKHITDAIKLNFTKRKNLEMEINEIKRLIAKEKQS
jgi:aminopeptidase N